MQNYTQKAIRELVCGGYAVDVTRHGTRDAEKLRAAEEGFDRIGASAGTYGINGLVFQGRTSGTLYAVIGRTLATFIYA